MGELVTDDADSVGEVHDRVLVRSGDRADHIAAFHFIVVEPPVLAAKEDGHPPFSGTDAFAQLAGRIKRHPHRRADRLAHLPGRGDHDTAPGEHVLDSADLRVTQHILCMGGAGFRLVAEFAGIDKHQPGKPEIFHHSCGKPHISLVKGGHEDDVESRA